MISTQLQHRDLNVTWEDYGKIGKRLAANIHKSGWKFDQILCIARGGMFVGDMMSRIFDKPLAVISATSYRGENGREKNKLNISGNIAMTTDSLGKRVLLVDDLVDSGNTLGKVKNSVEKQYPDIDIRTAVLWKKASSKFEPDFHADIVDKNVWIIQPFEKFDNVNPESLNQ